MRPMRAVLLLALLALGAPLFAAAPATSGAPTWLSVEMLAVGKGEAIVLHHRGQTVVVDTGFPEPGASVLVPHLRAEGVRSVKTIVLSHTHADHVGGCAAVVQNFTVPRIFYPGDPTDIPEWTGCMNASKAAGVRVVEGRHMKLGRPTPLLPEVNLTPLSANFTSTPRGPTDARNINEGSLVFMLTFRDVRMLFMGDAYCTTEGAILARGFDMDADVLKLGHHGLTTSSCQPLLDAVTPRILLASTPLQELPSKIRPRLEATGAELFLTGRDGTIVVRTDGATILATSER